MALQYCTRKLEELLQLVRLSGTLVWTVCVLNLAFSLVATCGNLLAIHAMWKASSIPANLKKLFLSLAFSDLAVGLIAQIMFGVIMAVVLHLTADANYHLDYLCPTLLSVCYFVLFLLPCASLLNLSTIALDRLLAIYLHLRYQELVSSKRVIAAVVSFWFLSAVAASVFISLSNNSRMVIAIVEVFGFLLTTLAYIYIYQVARYHHNQINCHLKLLDARAKDLLRHKKSAYNALLVYVVFIACYFPHFCTVVLQIASDSQFSFLAAGHATFFFVLLNSSLNPCIHCWRFREIRQIMKATVKKVLCTAET